MDQPRHLNLTGQVQLESGEPPSPHVRVELVCNSRVIIHTNTRTNGSFLLELGRRRRATEISARTSGEDATEIERRGLGGPMASGQLRTSGDGRYDLNNCEIRVPSTPAYSSSVIPLGVVSELEPDVGIIVLRKEIVRKGKTVSLTTLQAPSDAQKLFERARSRLAGSDVDYEKVAADLQEAVDKYPTFAEAWYLLGDARLYLSDPDGARAAFQQSISADPEYISPYIGLVGIELEEFHWQEASNLTTVLVELDPYSSKGQYYHGLANYSLGDFDTAVAALLVVEENGDVEEFPASLLLLGDIYARQGKVKASAEKLRSYLTMGHHTAETGQQIQKRLNEWESKGLIEPDHQ